MSRSRSLSIVHTTGGAADHLEAICTSVGLQRVWNAMPQLSCCAAEVKCVHIQDAWMVMLWCACIRVLARLGMIW